MVAGLLRGGMPAQGAESASRSLPVEQGASWEEPGLFETGAVASVSTQPLALRLPVE